MKIAIAGISGRMGRILIETILSTADAQLVGALDVIDSPYIGKDAGAFLGQQTGIAVTAEIKEAIAHADFLIDFTRPDGTMTHLAAVKQAGVKFIIGTTGFNKDQLQVIKQASQHLAIVLAPNMSVGVNITFKLLELAGKMLNSGYDIEILEAHHRHKEDAPSGTALRMGEILANAAFANTLSECAVYTRHGHTGERQEGKIGFSVQRGGDIVGDHTVLFAGQGERIEITHRSSSRASYAHGAIRAARFLQKQTNGLFDMEDVLGLR